MGDGRGALRGALLSRSVTASASAGGAAGAGGVGLQNRVFAWAAAAMVAEQPLTTLVAGTVVRVGAQTGFFLDDVGVQTDAGNFALFQAKAGLALGRTPESPLAKALKQAVEQYLHGRVPVADGTDRAIDPTRDALVLCTDSAAPSTVRNNLRQPLGRVGLQPPGTPLRSGLTARQWEALDVVLGHIRPMWIEIANAEPSDEDLRAFFRALRVVTVDASEGEPEHATSLALLTTALGTPVDARGAWNVLLAEGQDASARREWRDRPAIGVALSRGGIELGPPRRYLSDIAILRDLSAANRAALATDASLPVEGGLYVEREVSARLNSGAGDANVLIVGEAGAGKSAVAQRFASERAKTQEVIVLRAADVSGANRIALGAPLLTVLKAWTGLPGLVVIDGVDALRGAEDRHVLSKFMASLAGSRWQVVATARAFDASYDVGLRHAFAGSPISPGPEGLDQRFADVRHVRVTDLTDRELDKVVAAPLAVASLLKKASPELRALLRNPFNLRLATTLSEGLPAREEGQLLDVRSRSELLDQYWNHRVRKEDRTAREALLARLCREMVSQRTLRVLEAEPSVTSADSTAVGDLLSENVLSVDLGVVSGGRRVLTFSHNILFDYAVAIYVLLDSLKPDRLLGVLDADPLLPLVARPSLEVLVDLLWKDREAGVFWPLCLKLAGSTHVLASLAFASRVLNLVRGPDDLAELAPTPGRTEPVVKLLEAQGFTRQLIGALRTPAVLPDPTSAAAPLAVLALRLAENARTSYIDGALAADLLAAMQRRLPLENGCEGADERGQAVAALLDACRTDPKRMEGLADAATRQLRHVVRGSEAARASVERLLNDSAAMGQWGGTVLTWLADAVEMTLPVDPGLGVKVARAVLTFNEERDEQVEFAGSSPLLTLVESRKQQAEHAAYQLARSFGALCAADLVAAAEILCDLAEDTSFSDRPDAWPVTAGSTTGWLQYGRDLSMVAHGEAEKAAAAVGAALAGASAGERIEQSTPRTVVLHYDLLVDIVREGQLEGSIRCDVDPGDLAWAILMFAWAEDMALLSKVEAVTTAGASHRNFMRLLAAYTPPEPVSG